MITVDIPKPFEDELKRVYGEKLNAAIVQAIAADGFRTAQLSIGFVAKLLGLSIDETYGFLKERGVKPPEPGKAEHDLELAQLRARLGASPRP